MKNKVTECKNDIVFAGNILTDIVKRIDCYPAMGMLSNITSVTKAVGGCVPNTAIDLAKTDPSLRIGACGCVGDDEYGRFVLSQLVSFGIDVKNVNMTSAAPTSFSDVMSLASGERTFFHARGANALFSPDDIDIAGLSCSVLHIGYIMLLDCFDKKDADYGTVMARFLHRVQQNGIKTSIDAVSDSSADYAAVMIPAFRYCDYVIINEIECCGVWGLSPRMPDGSLDVKQLRTAMEKTMDCGVREKVIVHSREAGFCLSADGEFIAVPSLCIPEEEIRGSVGAGDVFCSGCLYGILSGFSDKKILEFASASAACNLFAENAVDGMRSASEIFDLMKKYPRRTV